MQAGADRRTGLPGVALTFEMVTERGSVIVDGFKQNLTVYSHAMQRPTWSYWGSDMNQAMIVSSYPRSVRACAPCHGRRWPARRGIVRGGV